MISLMVFQPLSTQGRNGNVITTRKTLVINRHQNELKSKIDIATQFNDQMSILFDRSSGEAEEKVYNYDIISFD